MNTNILAQHSTPELIALIVEQQAIINELSHCHLGIMSGGGIRRALSRLTGPVDIIAIDWRKLHEWNDILGYDGSNVFFAQFAQTRHTTDRRATMHTHRPLDVRGQWGGDELVFAVGAGDGIGLLMRLIASLDALTAQLNAGQRAAITTCTGGLVDGFCIVAVLIPNSTDVYHRDTYGRDAGDVARAVAECGRLKAGTTTGARATSGAAGTIIGTLMPGGF